MATRTFHVSIDFGTCSSGFAYAAQHGEVITHQDYLKAPFLKNLTSLLYERKPGGSFGAPKAWGWDARIQYMGMSPEARTRHAYEENFKLSMAPSNLVNMNQYQPNPDLPGDKLVADYLKELSHMAKKVLKKRWEDATRA